MDLPIEHGGSFQFVFCKPLPGRVSSDSGLGCIRKPWAPRRWESKSSCRMKRSDFSGRMGLLTLWWTNILLWKDPPFFMGKSTISIAIFNSFLYVYQRVNDRWMSRSFWMNYCMMCWLPVYISIYHPQISNGRRFQLVKHPDTSGYYRYMLSLHIFTISWI